MPPARLKVLSAGAVKYAVTDLAARLARATIALAIGLETAAKSEKPVITTGGGSERRHRRLSEQR
jgi:hypothetical protein